MKNCGAVEMMKRPPPPPGIEQIPAAVVFAGMTAVWNPLDPADGNNLLASGHVGDRLLGVHPIGIDQKPARPDLRQVGDDGMHNSTLPGRIGDEVVCITRRYPAGIQESLAMSHVGVACLETFVPEIFQVIDQLPVTTARLIEGGERFDMWQQGEYSSCWRWVVVTRLARKV